MGSIRRSPANRNRWQARYRDPSGAQRTRTFPSQADAKAFLAAVETDMLRGDWRDPTAGRTTFNALADEWLSSNSSKRATSLARDAVVLRKDFRPVLGGLPIAKVRPAQIKGIVDSMIARGLVPSTIRS